MNPLHQAAMKRTLSRLKPCPAPDDGVHKWIYYAACTLVEAGCSNEDAIEIIEEMMTRDPDPASEIEDALAAARGEKRQRSPRWSPSNLMAVRKIVQDGPTVLGLISKSPEPIRFGEPSRVEETIDALFPGNPWLCVGKADDSFFTGRRETLRGCLHRYSLIVPSPMFAQKGLTKQGRSSFHSLANTGPRRFIVVEFDKGPLDQQAAILWHLARYAPLALVVFSGSKSAHGWFFCAGQPEDKVQRFFDYAHSLGADALLWTRSQFVRMPDGMRSDGKTGEALIAAGVKNVPPGRQAVLYFNPEVIK
jgi:hypothetical protein